MSIIFGRYAFEESWFAFHRPMGMLYGDVTGDKDIHGVFKTMLIDEFDALVKVVRYMVMYLFFMPSSTDKEKWDMKMW